MLWLICHWVSLHISWNSRLFACFPFSAFLWWWGSYEVCYLYWIACTVSLARGKKRSFDCSHGIKVEWNKYIRISSGGFALIECAMSCFWWFAWMTLCPCVFFNIVRLTFMEVCQPFQSPRFLHCQTRVKFRVLGHKQESTHHPTEQPSIFLIIF